MNQEKEQPTTKNEKRRTKNLCIIPARGGSKRIPRKNIKDFLGKPIIAYSIEVALESGLFDEVMVSTDDQEIADVAIKYGASVPFMRSKANADDYASTLDVVKEVLDTYKNRNLSFDKVCIIYPTAPFVKRSRLKSGFEKLEHYDAAIPVAEFSYPVWRAFKLENDNLKYQWPEFEKSRSQDLDALYHDAGQWYWIKAQHISDTLVPDKTSAVLLNTMEVQDIDTPQDWELAELKFQKMKTQAQI